LLHAAWEGGGWVVDADTGETREVVYPRSGGDVDWSTVDDAGAVVEASYTMDDGAWFVDWAEGTARRVGLDERLVSLAARGDAVAAGQDYTVIVADRSTLVPRAVLPYKDEDSSFVDGRMGVVALLDDNTVLLQVPVYAPQHRDFSWRIVAWQPGTGDLGLVTRGEGPVPASYAVGLLD
jgi:hypothetical protein